MAKVTIELPNGEKNEFVHAYGLTYNSRLSRMIPNGDLISHIEDIRNLKIRDDDIYLATYPKCGTHWVWEIVVMLKRGNAEYETKTKEAAFLDFRSSDIVEKIPSPRVLNCHYPCKLMPREIVQKGTKIVHVMRNPKDVFVSFFHHMKSMFGGPEVSFQEFLPRMLGEYGLYNFYPWFQYVKEWERFSKQHPEQILNLFFEDLKEDPVREIKKINTFLGLERSGDLIKEIAEACDFKNLKKADAEIKEISESVLQKKIGMPNMYRKEPNFLGEAYVLCDDLIEYTVYEFIRPPPLIHMGKFAVTCGEQEKLETGKITSQLHRTKDLTSGWKKT